MTPKISNGVNKQTIMTLIVILAGLTGLVLWSKTIEPVSPSETVSKSNPARTGGTLVADELSYDFGKISMKDGNVSKTFKVTNTGGEDVNVPSLYTSCMCTTAYILNVNGTKKGPFGMPGHGAVVAKANEVIKAGETREIEVVYDPNAHGPAGVGLIERSVFLEDENKSVVEFKFRASVTP